MLQIFVIGTPPTLWFEYPYTIICKTKLLVYPLDNFSILILKGQGGVSKIWLLCPNCWNSDRWIQQHVSFEEFKIDWKSKQDSSQSPQSCPPKWGGIFKHQKCYWGSGTVIPQLLDVEHFNRLKVINIPLNWLNLSICSFKVSCKKLFVSIKILKWNWYGINAFDQM